MKIRFVYTGTYVNHNNWVRNLVDEFTTSFGCLKYIVSDNIPTLNIQMISEQLVVTKLWLIKLLHSDILSRDQRLRVIETERVSVIKKNRGH